MFVGHVPKEGEDHKAGEETGQRVDGAGDDGVSGSIKSNKIIWNSPECEMNQLSAVIQSLSV